MTPKALWIWINYESPVANATAKAFLIGFGFTAFLHLVGEKFEVVTLIIHAFSRAWWLQFLQDSFNAAATAAIGILTPNLFPAKSANPKYVNTQP